MQNFEKGWLLKAPNRGQLDQGPIRRRGPAHFQDKQLLNRLSLEAGGFWILLINKFSGCAVDARSTGGEHQLFQR